MSDLDWAVDDFGKPDYLDGIKSRYMVYAGGARRIPIGYFFQQDAATLAAAAPALLLALKAIVNSDMAMREEDEGRISKELAAARAALSRASTP